MNAGESAAFFRAGLARFGASSTMIHFSCVLGTLIRAQVAHLGA